MALKTVGTTTTTALSGIAFSKAMSAANMALLQQGIKNDQINGFPVFPGAFSSNGVLYVPNRGSLVVLPGDVIAWDSVTGWPILVSAKAVAAGGSKWAVSA